jgi:hypothetical protein
MGQFPETFLYESGMSSEFFDDTYKMNLTCEDSYAGLALDRHRPGHSVPERKTARNNAALRPVKWDLQLQFGLVESILFTIGQNNRIPEHTR